MRWRFVTGLFLIVVALGQTGLAVFALGQAHDGENRVQVAWVKTDGQCRTAAAEIGTVTDIGTSMSVQKVVLPGEDWRVALMDASSVISYCSTRRMTYFCMGRDCSGDVDAQTNLENQEVTPSRTELLRSEPVQMSFKLLEITQ